MTRTRQTIDCTVTPPVGNLQLPSGYDTCTWWTTGRINDTSQGHVVPFGGGVITSARVRVGPVTGPMQFVVMRSLRHPGSLAEPACCYPVGACEVFTPAPNAITTVPMNAPVKHETDLGDGHQQLRPHCDLDPRPGLQSRRRGRTAGAARTVTYATVRFSVPAGRRRTVRLKLNRAARRLVRKRRSARVWANLTLPSGERVSERVTLRR